MFTTFVCHIVFWIYDLGTFRLAHINKWAQINKSELSVKTHFLMNSSEGPFSFSTISFTFDIGKNSVFKNHLINSSWKCLSCLLVTRTVKGSNTWSVHLIEIKCYKHYNKEMHIATISTRISNAFLMFNNLFNNSFHEYIYICWTSGCATGSWRIVCQSPWGS